MIGVDPDADLASIRLHCCCVRLSRQAPLATGGHLQIGEPPGIPCLQHQRSGGAVVSQSHQKSLALRFDCPNHAGVDLVQADLRLTKQADAAGCVVIGCRRRGGLRGRRWGLRKCCPCQVGSGNDKADASPCCACPQGEGRRESVGVIMPGLVLFQAFASS